jgi:hypothetical protein
MDLQGRGDLLREKGFDMLDPVAHKEPIVAGGLERRQQSTQVTMKVDFCGKLDEAQDFGLDKVGHFHDWRVTKTRSTGGNKGWFELANKKEGTE